MEEAAEANRIIIIEKGKILADGTPFELKEKYARDIVKIYCNSSQYNTLTKILEESDFAPEHEEFA